MNGIVIQLQAEALDVSVDIETLLRKAYLAARKLNLTDFEKWISSEQNGYDKDVPDYRKIGGQIQAWNPMHGWVPVVMHGKMKDFASKMPIPFPISTVSHAYHNSDGSLRITVSGDMNELFNKLTHSIPTEYSFQTTKAEMHTIISAVRNRVLEWALLLEENGIIGEELSFSSAEKDAAASSTVITNYTNNFFSSSDNTRIEQGNEFYK